MPPKDAKGKKGGGKAPKKEVDKALYVRKPLEPNADATEVPPLKPVLKGVINNIESLFPEWEVAGENWGESAPLESVLSNEGKCPIILPIGDSTPAVYKGIKVLLGIDGELPNADPKAKGKKADPKKGAPAAEIIEELEKDEGGRDLPRVFIDDESSPFDGYTLPSRGFNRDWSEEQINRRNYQNELKASLDMKDVDVSGLSEEEINEKKQQLQLQYDNEISTRDVEKEAPNGPERDQYICDAFRIIARLAPSIIQAKTQIDSSAPVNTIPFGSSGMEYLWNSIYPKLPNGRPCYNPSGKYCVRLFLGGKWRKVTVSDEVPVDSNHVPVVASSTNKLELWPTILAKAIYTVYTSCGYNTSLPRLDDVTVDADSGTVTRRPSPVNAASFTGFVIHALTGWQPSTAWSVGRTVSLDSVRTKRLIQEILFGGALLIEHSNIPGTIPVASVVQVTESSELKTKKRFEEDYRRRLAERERIEQQIALREQQISEINGKLGLPFSEGYVLVTTAADGTVQVLPILAISYAEHDAAGEDLREAKLLVQWKIVKTVKDLEEERVVNNTSLTPYLGGLDQPSPPATEIVMEWITVKDLVTNASYIYGVNTLTTLASREALGWHWMASAAAVDTGKGKDAKKGAKVEAAPVISEAVDQGAMPPVLLSIDTASFFSIQSTQPSDDSEEAAAIAAQQDELANVTKSVTYVPKAAYLTVSVYIHADMLQEPVGDSSSTVLVLQEMRFDGVAEPLVMRVELSGKSSIPYARGTFQIPYSKVSPTQPLLFWVRLFSTASVYMTFGASVNFVIGAAETIWKNLGKPCLVREGECEATKPSVEQVICRAPLLLAADGDDDSESPALVFFYISNRDIANAVSLLMLCDARSDVTEEVGYALPTLQGNVITLYTRPSRVKTLIARCYGLENGKVAIPPFTWKLLVLSNKSVVEPVRPFYEPSLNQRYSGSYFPNNKLLLLRDTISVDKQTFPLAFRLMVSNTSSDGSPAIEPDDVCLVCKLYRASDRKLISEFAGRTLLQLYDIQIRDYLVDGEAEPVYTPVVADAKGKAPPKKDDKKGKGGSPGDDGCKILIEVLLDETRMVIPADWRSKYPVVFDGQLAQASTEGVSRVSKLNWQVEVLSGNVLEMSHDTYDLERYANQKNQWEDSMEGRSERAMAALAYYQERKLLNESAAGEPVVLNDALLEKLGVALEKELALVKSREELLLSIPEYKEYHEPQRENDPIYVDQSVIDANKAKRAEELLVGEENAKRMKELLVQYNARLRDETKVKIAALIDEAKQHTEVLGELWKERENCRLDIENKNNALKVLLDKATKAIETIVEKEEEEEFERLNPGKKKPPAKKK
jgi:hypothetical protein